MDPLYYAISFILMQWHSLWTWLGLSATGGAAWALSIIGLTLIIRAALIPLFVKQIKSSRNMQLIQPNEKGVLTETDARQFGDSELWGVPLSGSLFNAGGEVGIIVMAALLVVAMTA